jgi:DNA-3-methyladenine glycosylase I
LTPTTPRQPARCGWVDLAKIDYVRYHDEEWGVPVFDDRKLFEFLTLESAQAGLSWYTILRKRESYRRALAGFDPVEVARFTPRHIDRLMQDPGLVRHRRKLEATLENARSFLDAQATHGSFARYAWQFVEGRPVQNCWRDPREVPTTSAASDAMSKDMKRRGFQFVGSTTCYAYMQAVGMVFDHLTGCFRHEQIAANHARAACP